MKRKVGLSILVMFLAVTVLPCFAAPPPTDPPADPPRTRQANLIGTWEGTVWVAQESRYSHYTMTLKVTEQKNAMFRGYVTDATGSYVFVAGVIAVNNQLVLVTKDGTWFADMWWGDTPGMNICLADSSVPAMTGGTLIKTTK